MRDFSEVEDSRFAFKIIKSIAVKAGRDAMAESKAAGLPHIFVRNNQVIRIHANGKEEIIATRPPKGNQFYFFYQPGTIFHFKGLDPGCREI
jgi:hypothetical protein